MFLKTFITLTICVALQSCSTTTPFSSKNNDQSNCTPKATFNPSEVNVSSSGVFAFLSKKQNFNYDFINYKWICKKPIAPMVARFEQPDAKLLLKSIILFQCFLNISLYFYKNSLLIYSALLFVKIKMLSSDVSKICQKKFYESSKFVINIQNFSTQSLNM